MSDNLLSSDWPKDRKPRSKEGKFDELGFFYTPNGSFYDPDGEYFNKKGYDIHGGFYTDNKEYIYGPDFIEELGCYADEKEKYENYNEDYLSDEPEVDEEIIEDGDEFNMECEDGNDYEKILEEAKKYKESLNK